MSILQGLEGMNIRYIKSDIAITNALNTPDNEYSLEVPVEILIGEYTLYIYNPIIIKGLKQQVALSSFSEYKVKSIIEEDISITMEFQDEIKLVIDLREESYTGPEAMSLHGPNDLIVVWG